MRALSLGPAGVTELSDRTGLPKSTVSRLLSSLETEQAVEQNEAGSYELGVGIDALESSSRIDRNVIEVARPHMVELMELTGEAVGLNRLDGDEVTPILQIDDPESDVLVRDWTGVPSALHMVPAGLVLLAFGSRSHQSRYVDADLESATEATMTDADQLRSRFRAIREEGFCWVFGELSEEINSVAAPIADSADRYTMALHVHGPAYRFPGDLDRVQLGNQVAATAERIEAQLSS